MWSIFEPMYMGAVKSEEAGIAQSYDEWKKLALGFKRSCGRVILCKWVFKIKTYADGSIDKYKARLIIKRFSQYKEWKTIHIWIFKNNLWMLIVNRLKWEGSL